MGASNGGDQLGFSEQLLLAAAIVTVVLTIPTMDCATCPITIRLALLPIKGVSKVRVSYDDAQTTLGALTQATADLGYPSFEADDPP